MDSNRAGSEDELSRDSTEITGGSLKKYHDEMVSTLENP
jgi:hypothetical protein